MNFHAVLCVLLLWPLASRANVEKVIFLAPPTPTSPGIPSLDLSRYALNALSPAIPSLRTQLPVQFPRFDSPKGLQYWLLLSNLEPGRRFEVRVCWAAIQPTKFDLLAHPVDTVFATESLVSALEQYSFRSDREDLSGSTAEGTKDAAGTSPEASSSILLQLFAAADYFTSNEPLMNQPPPVKVDIILDPYLLNVLPRSLLPTAFYLVFLAIGSWFLSSLIWRWIRDIAQSEKLREE